MKKIVLTTALISFAALVNSSSAQSENGNTEKKETQEIIIRKKGDKDTKLTVEIKGDDITVNGKPLSDYKDENITVNKRKIIIGNKFSDGRFQFDPLTVEGFSINSDMNSNSAFLGVSTEQKDGGASIINVSKESAAEKAGLKKGDIITKLGDKNIDGPQALFDAVSAMKPKDNVTIYYKRDGKESSTQATLGESKSTKAWTYSFNSPDGNIRTYKVPGVRLNPKIESWDDKDFDQMAPRIWSPRVENNIDKYYFNNVFPRQQRLGIKIQDTEDGKGVKILDVDKDSPAEKAGLKKDDVVTEIGGEKVANTDDARDQLEDNKDKSSYTLKASRNGNKMSFEIKIPKKLKTANL